MPLKAALLMVGILVTGEATDMNYSNYTLIEIASIFAERAHRGQTRKYDGAPYVNHCYNVYWLAEERTSDKEILAAAILHDTIEDTPTTYEQLVSIFGSRVAGIVLELTDVYTKADYPELNRAERKKLEAKRMAGISDDAKLVKLCDLIDNTSSIVRHDPGFAKVYLREKADMLESMGF